MAESPEIIGLAGHRIGEVARNCEIPCSFPCCRESRCETGSKRLRPPPRILSNGDISRRLPNSPPLVGIWGGGSFSAETLSGLKANLPGLSLGREIPFPRCRSHSKAATGPNIRGYGTESPSIWR